MRQRTQGVGIEAHCGPARSPLLGPGAGHLNQKEGVREAAKSRPLKPASSATRYVVSAGWGLRAGNRGQGLTGQNPTLHAGQRLVRVEFTRNSGWLHDHQSKPLTLRMPMAGSVPS